MWRVTQGRGRGQKFFYLLRKCHTIWVIYQPTPAMCTPTHSSSVSIYPIYLPCILPPFSVTSFLISWSLSSIPFYFTSKIFFGMPSTLVGPLPSQFQPYDQISWKMLWMLYHNKPSKYCMFQFPRAGNTLADPCSEAETILQPLGM